MRHPEDIYRPGPELPLFASSAPVSGNGAEGGDSALKESTLSADLAQVPDKVRASRATGKEHSIGNREVAELGRPQSAESVAPTRRGMPETSFKAARSLTNLGRTKERILDTLRKCGPLTDEGIAAKFIERYGENQASPSGLRTRRSWLVDHGLVCDSGQRARTQSGRESIVWRVK